MRSSKRAQIAERAPTISAHAAAAIETHNLDHVVRDVDRVSDIRQERPRARGRGHLSTSVALVSDGSGGCQQ